MIKKYELNKGCKNERDFNSWYLKQLRGDWYWAYKISDAEALSLKPFDSFVVHPNWRAIAIEFKMINCYKSNIRSSLRPHQRAHLREFNWDSYVIVFNRKMWDYRIYRFEEVSDEQTLIFNKK